jgi:hypothetical protein
VKESFQKSLAAGLEGVRRAGFLLALVAGSAALGLLIAWPLWLFATSARQVYTITVLSLSGAGVVFLTVRAGQRRRKARHEAGKPRRSLLAVMLTAVMVAVAVAGAYLAAALVVRGLWVIGAAEVVLWVGLLWLIGRGRRAAKDRKVRTVPAENAGR